jgi:hypothetical protein
MRRVGCRIEEQVEEQISGTSEAHRTLGIRVFMSPWAGSPFKS